MSDQTISLSEASAASLSEAPTKVPVRQDWRMPDELWERLEPLLPVFVPKPHPLGCHRRRIPSRQAMDGIFFVLRTGCQWNALNATGLCSSSVAHSRYQEWCAAGVFEKLWAQGLAEYEAQVGLDWDWLSMDGAITKAPGVKKKGHKTKGSAQIPRTGPKPEPSAAF